MSGRFFSLLVFLSVGNLILISEKITWKKTYNVCMWLLILIVLFLGLSHRFPVLASQYHTLRGPLDYSGAIDERFFYYGAFGLLSKHRNGWPDIINISDTKPDEYHIQCGGLGALSAENPHIYAIDSCALIDPFLSKMPAVRFNGWRPGHNYRKIPTNFGEFLIGKVQNVQDEMLIEFFRDINLVARGDLLKLDRLKAIWKLNTNYDYNVDWKKYTDPKIWVSNSTFFQKEVIENWDTPLTNLVRNQNWEVISKSQKISNKILVDIAFDYRFNVYINDEFVLTLNEGVRCEEGKLINLINLTEVNSIKFLAVNMIPSGIPTSTAIKNLKVLDSRDIVPSLESNCIFTVR